MVTAWGTSATDLYLSTGKGGISHSGDDGASWQAIGGSPACVAFAGATGNVVRIANDVFQSKDNGQTWNALNAVGGLGPTPRLKGVWASASVGDIYAVGTGGPNGSGIIVHSSDGGVTWTAEDACGAPDLETLWESSPNDVYVITSNQYVLHHKN